MTMTWFILDHTIHLFQVIKHAYNYCSPFFIFSLAMLAVITYRDEKVQPIGLIDWGCRCALCDNRVSRYGVEIRNRRAAIVLYIRMHLHITATQLIIQGSCYFIFHQVFIFTAPVAQKVQYIVLYGIAQVKAISAARAINDTFHKKFMWPDIKE
ncbi:hypothetical protein BJV82DRAFT_591871 [Fennellomyces sp. T-0311]|nr:hypothetical protein BJV82DRAFT_591871 [Fennellomyces sp. T-0311]